MVELRVVGELACLLGSVCVCGWGQGRNVKEEMEKKTEKIVDVVMMDLDMKKILALMHIDLDCRG